MCSAAFLLSSSRLLVFVSLWQNLPTDLQGGYVIAAIKLALLA